MAMALAAQSTPGKLDEDLKTSRLSNGKLETGSENDVPPGEGGFKNSSINESPCTSSSSRVSMGSTGAESNGSAQQTIIRLKRRIEDSPSKILLLNYKRQKTAESSTPQEERPSPASYLRSPQSSKENSEEEDDSYSQVLRLVGTVPGIQVDNSSIAATVKTVLSTTSTTNGSSFSFPARRSVKTTGTSKIGEKARQSFGKSIAESRFRIVNSKRGILNDDPKAELSNENDGGWKEEKELLNLLDLVPESNDKPKKRPCPEGFEPGNVTCNGVPMIKEASDSNENDSDYVYDLYLINEPFVDETMFGELVSVEEADDELDFSFYRESAVEASTYLEGDEDSNAEDNWRNDYPDSEGEGLRDEDDGPTYDNDDRLYGGLRSLKVKDDSSDDEDLIYGIDDDGANYDMGFNKRYSRYKRRVENEYADEVVSSESDCD